MKKIFLDVGGHEGQTLLEVLRPVYQFDAIHCFEPMLENYQLLKQKFSASFGGKLFHHPFGLIDRNGRTTLYGSNQMGEASIFSDKQDLVQPSRAVSCDFRSAAEFLKDHMREEDIIIMKLNCEGGEILILRDLIATGLIHWISHMMIDFDIRKVPSRKHQAQEILSDFKKIGFSNYLEPRQAMIGYTHQERIRFWLVHLPFAENFIELTSAQRMSKRLPLWLARFLAWCYKKYRRIFTKS